MKLSGQEDELREALVRLGDNLRTLRQAAGWSRKGLAEAAGIDRTSLMKIEAGTQNPSVGMLLKISRVMKLSVHHLLSGVE